LCTRSVPLANKQSRSDKWGPPRKGSGDSRKLRPTQITRVKGRSGELKRQVTGLLNRISPKNQEIIVEQLADIELQSADELNTVIRVIFSKALDDPHYCATYADMVVSLKSRYPQFPPAVENEKPHTFVRLLLNTCQEEFENLPITLDPSADEQVRQKMMAEDIEIYRKKTKDKALANMKFIGHLYLRQMLAGKIVDRIVHSLLSREDTEQGVPQEHMVECACTLLAIVGYVLEQTSHGRAMVAKFCRRLLDLKSAKDTNGKAVFSSRVRFIIQDFLDLKTKQWVKK